MQVLKLDVDFEEILSRAVEVGQAVADGCYAQYEKNWFPCGNAHIILNGVAHRKMINYMKREGQELTKGCWRGSYGRLMKTSRGFWYSIPLRRESQSMNYKIEIYRAIQTFFATRNISVELGSYVD